MPIDKDGNRCHLVMDVKSTPSRLNVGRLYEHAIKGSLLKVKNIILKELKDKNLDVHNLNNDYIKYLFGILVEFLEILENNQTLIYKNAYNSNDYDSMREALLMVVDVGFIIKLEAGHEDDIYKYEIIKRIEKSRFMPLKDKVKYVIDGKLKESKEDIMIAPMYIIILSKIADDILTTSSASLNHFGIPTVVSKKDRYRMPHRNSPVKIAGESEIRALVAYGSRELVAEIKDMNTSVKSHSLVYDNILNAETPTDIDTVINRKQHPYGSDRALEILNTLNNSVGMELCHVKDKHSLVEVDNASLKEIGSMNKIERFDEE